MSHHEKPPVLQAPPPVAIGFDSKPVTIFSAPRKFDTATILIVTFCYAATFGFLIAIGIPKLEVSAAILYVTIVAACQPVLFRGKMPRVASVAGGVIASFVVFVMMLFFNWDHVEPAVFTLVLPTLIGGGIFGYLAGALVGGVFLVTHYWREYLESRKKKVVDDDSEFIMEDDNVETETSKLR